MDPTDAPASQWQLAESVSLHIRALELLTHTQERGIDEGQRLRHYYAGDIASEVEPEMRVEQACPVLGPVPL
jgi:hypothetical protein